MRPIIDIPVNTMLAELDAGLRRLLEPELARQGFGGVNVVFDAPTREWASALSAPTVNLFLYDLTEAGGHRTVEWGMQHVDGALRDLRPPLRLQASYAVTAWTRGVEDEHRLLSQVIGILYAHPALPAEVVEGTLAAACHDDPVETALARDRTERRADFWSAIGGQYKPSVDYGVVLPFPSGRALERGKPVRTRVVRSRLTEASTQPETRHLLTGCVVYANGDPAADCWVTLPDAGRAAITDERGEFTIDGVASGQQVCLARARDGAEGRGDIRLPGPSAELTLARRRRRS
jgi:hypothetical protein